MSLFFLGLRGDELLDAKGPKSAGKIGRPLFDVAAEELCTLGMSSFNGETHKITDRGRKFFEQRFDRLPVKGGMFACDHRLGSKALPPMGRRLEDELSATLRSVKVAARATTGLCLVLILLMFGLAMYAQTH